MGKEKKKDKNKEESIDKIKILFWNMARIKNEGKRIFELYRKIRRGRSVWNMIGGKEWMKMEKLLLKSFNWYSQHAERDKNKDRAKGRIITEVRKGLREIEVETIVNGIYRKKD